MPDLRKNPGETDERVMSMAALGTFGRFGNQVFQYAFLRLAARASGARVECGPWPGRVLFGHDDPDVTANRKPLIERAPDGASMFDAVPSLIEYVESLRGMRSGRIGPAALTDGSEDGDLIGHFQYHTRYYRPFRNEFRALFKPSDDLRPWLDEPLAVLRGRGRTIVAIHMRLGDYAWLPQLPFALSVPSGWWLEWLDSVWHTLDEPVLYLCSDNVDAMRKRFSRFDPLTESDMRVAPPPRVAAASAAFFRDYHVMTQADVLGISNSTFSFSAAMLNERAFKFVRPHWDFSTRFTEFDPWDARPLLYTSTGSGGFLRSYPQMVRSAWATGGSRGVFKLVFVQQPAGAAFVARGRVWLAMKQKWLRIVKRSHS